MSSITPFLEVLEILVTVWLAVLAIRAARKQRWVEGCFWVLFLIWMAQ